MGVPLLGGSTVRDGVIYLTGWHLAMVRSVGLAGTAEFVRACVLSHIPWRCSDWGATSFTVPMDTEILSPAKQNISSQRIENLACNSAHTYIFARLRMTSLRPVTIRAESSTEIQHGDT